MQAIRCIPSNGFVPFHDSRTSLSSDAEVSFRSFLLKDSSLATTQVVCTSPMCLEAMKECIEEYLDEYNSVLSQVRILAISLHL